MRSLFIVVSKIWGLMQAYTGLTYIFTLLLMLRLRGQSGSAAGDAWVTTASVISQGAMVILTFGIAWLLIFRTDWLADKLKIPTADAPASPAVETILYAGVKLIGLFIIVRGIPLLPESLFQMGHFEHFDAYMWSSLSRPLIQIIIGLLLMFKTQPTVSFIMKNRGQNNTLDGKA